MSKNGLTLGIAPVCSPASELSRVSMDPSTDHQNIDLKQMDCQLLLQLKWVHSGSTKNCNLRSATMACHLLAPASQERAHLNGELEWNGKGSWEGSSKQRLIGIENSKCRGYSLAEL